MGKTLYLECNCGISGDMMVAALLDLGADWEHLEKVLETIKAGGYQVSHGRVKKAGIDCMDFRVILDREHENHDHDMDYLHGSHIPHGGGGIPSDSPEPGEGHACHEAGSGDIHDHGHHEHRGMRDITQIIDSCRMSDRARDLAKKIFGILAEAEAKAHGISVEQVHFHEVGAIDSIVDILSVAVCLDDLGIEDVIVTGLCEGTGTIRCQHGVLPIPVPAVVGILSAYELPVEITGVKGELITPTGAAIVAAIRTRDTLPDRFVIKKIGLGAGKRNYERPSILRAMLIEEQKKSAEQKRQDGDEAGQTSQGQTGDTIIKLESNIDDCTGEELGLVMEKLFEAGARDVHYTPVFMKKNRPGYQINVVCLEKDIEKLEQIIFGNTTTIGIRRLQCERSVLPREMIKVDTRYGRVSVKKCTMGETVKYYPEYECVAGISREKAIPYRDIYLETVQKCLELGGN